MKNEIYTKNGKEITVNPTKVDNFVRNGWVKKSDIKPLKQKKEVNKDGY